MLDKSGGTVKQASKLKKKETFYNKVSDMASDCPELQMKHKNCGLQ